MPTFTVFSLPAVVARRRVLNSIFFCLHNGGSMSFVLLYPSIQGACSCSWLGWFLWRQQTRVCFSFFSFFSFLFSLHPFPPIFPLKEVTDALEGLLRGLRSCFARIIPFPPFSIPGCSKNCRDFSKWCLESCFGISYFCLCTTLFFFFFLHSLANIFFCTISFVF